MNQAGYNAARKWSTHHLDNIAFKASGIDAREKLMRLSKTFAGGTALACLVAASTSLAAVTGITGEKPLVCASQDVVACTEGPSCMQGNAGTFDLPTFMFIDFKSRHIRGVEEDGSEVNSPIKAQEITDQSLIMQGFENHRGWTMAVDRVQGRFTLSVTGPEVDFMITGICTAI